MAHLPSPAQGSVTGGSDLCSEMSAWPWTEKGVKKGKGLPEGVGRMDAQDAAGARGRTDRTGVRDEARHRVRRGRREKAVSGVGGGGDRGFGTRVSKG